MPERAVEFSAAVLLVLSHAVGAQSALTGTVASRTNRQPLQAVEVSIEALGRVTRTDSLGAYSFADLPPGLRAIRFRFPGYQPLSVVVQLSAGQIVRRDVVLERIPVVLDSVRIVAERRRLARFEDNRRVGLGHFLTAADLENQHAVNLAQVLSSLASAKIWRGGGTHAWVANNRPGRRAIRPDVGDRIRGAVSACYSNVFVDGAQVYHGRDGEPLFDLSEIPIDRILGIEFYSGPAEAPIEYSSPDMDCGVLAIWTNR